MECRKVFYEFRLMDRLLPDIAEVLGVSDDTGENADELEGACQLAVGTEDGVFIGNPSARVRDEIWLQRLKKQKRTEL